ncbi:iron chaperone [Nakamurella leprariae]|uniref:DUF1801 domain-containing protein n=1 Tax=Nakamurella leprariae TaxID=2803911 RepID=A0A939C094_9ACTN|nr:DUF1801 domain-containing protein [Nakamurella leprariae]MBM9468521.1 DUF1801 domain-containing protein [Nakamurella leprariae]
MSTSPVSASPPPSPDVERYLADFDVEVRERLQDMRRAIHQAVPGAGETISHQMPAITLDGTPVVWFAGWRRHLSMYPVPPADELLERRIGRYRHGADTVRFPLADPLPVELVGRIARLIVGARP